MDDELFNNLKTQTKKFSELEGLLNTFVDEFIDVLSVLTQYHLYPGSHSPDSLLAKIKKDIQSGEYVKIHSYMLCKEIQQILTDFADTDGPKGEQLKYSKKEFPVYDEVWVEQQMQSLLKGSAATPPQDMVVLRQELEKQRVGKAHYLEYQKAIYKELKKLVLKHCPHMTGISGNGLRQIDYMLREYMYKITENIQPLVDD